MDISNNYAKSIFASTKELLEASITPDSDCISVYDLWQWIIIEKRNELELLRRLRKEAESILDKIDNSEYFSVTFHFMHYANSELKVEITKFLSYCNTRYNETFYFRKAGEELYLRRREGDNIFGEEILEILGDEIKKWYNYECFLRDTDCKREIKSINSEWCVKFYGSHIILEFDSDFYFFLVADSGEITLTRFCTDKSFKELVMGAEKILAKKIFVRIDDCPKCVQQRIQNMRLEKERENQRREEERRIREEEERKLAKKQKRREFWKKIIPFIK